MRVMLATAVFLAGCLHARGPGRSANKDEAAHLRAFELLVNDADTIDDAEAFAKAKVLDRDGVVEIAERAYWSFMRGTIYPPAAEIAYRFGFGKRAIALALEAQRKDAVKAIVAYLDGKERKGSHARLYAAIWELRHEMRISCRYGPTPEAAKETVERAVMLEAVSGEDDALYPLLDEGCPVDATLRMSIIDTALLEDKDAYAIRHGAASKWDPVRTSQFLWGFFNLGDCTDGIVALGAFKVPLEEAVKIVQEAKCETETIDSRAWKLPKDAASAYFFAAVRGAKYNLALELLPHGALGDDGRTFLYQEAMRAKREIDLVKVLKLHPGFHDPFMAYAFERGRYRFVANFSQTLDWQRTAFDKLLELGKWEDAAEAADYGVSEGLRKEGVLLAFRAAMAAGDFKAGRYFVARYGPVKDKPGVVTQAMYEEEREKWYAAKKLSDPKYREPEPERKPKRKRKKPKRKPCPDGDWCP